MDKELENRPDIMPGDAGIDHEPENIAADEVSEQSAEIVFTSDFTVSDVIKHALKAQKHNLLKSFPKALLYCVLLMMPPLLLVILGMSKLGSSVAAGRAIEVIALLVPVVFGGPLFMGIMGGAMEISRGRTFKTGRLFFAFRDSWFLKAVGSYVLFCAAVLIINIVFMIPAVIVSALSAGLGDGFAAVATQVIVILLSIGGAVLAAQFYLRFALMIPLLIEHPEMKVIEAARFSIKAMKGNTWKLFVLFISYIGWYILSFAVAGAIVGGAAAAGYAYVKSLFYSGDIYNAYMWLLIGITVMYIAAYIAFTIATSTVIMRPLIGWAAFYDTITGYEPPEEELIITEETTADACAADAYDADEPETNGPETEPAEDASAEEISADNTSDECLSENKNEEADPLPSPEDKDDADLN
ncbi:MAG: DUF975 family protein [Anaerovoracaceae bacterium]|nr:DUF975 family protein [Bacillota bacterium]MDY5906116.1 DUF975 family protein [Anaerovoracaceae bacterium]